MGKSVPIAFECITKGFIEICSIVLWLNLLQIPSQSAQFRSIHPRFLINFVKLLLVGWVICRTSKNNHYTTCLLPWWRDMNINSVSRLYYLTNVLYEMRNLLLAEHKTKFDWVLIVTILIFMMKHLNHAHGENERVFQCKLTIFGCLQCCSYSWHLVLFKDVI